MKEIKKYFEVRQSRFKNTDILKNIIAGTISWSPTVSSVAPALDVLGLGPDLVANSTRDYVRIATYLLKDSGREDAYAIRVRLFDALDRLPVGSPCFSTSTFIPPAVNITNGAGDIVSVPCPCASPHVGLGRSDQPINERFVRGLDNRIGGKSKQGLFLSDLERYFVVLIASFFVYSK